MSALKTIVDFFYQSNSLGFSAIGLCLIVTLPFAIFLLVGAAYVTTLQKTLNAISIQNRAIKPEQLKWLFIPFFGLVWHFKVVKKIEESLQHEYERMRQFKGDTTTYQVGRAMCILNLCWLLPFLGEFAIIASFVCFVVYWIRIRSYRDKLSHSIL